MLPFGVANMFFLNDYSGVLGFVRVRLQSVWHCAPKGDGDLSCAARRIQILFPEEPLCGCGELT